MTHIYLCTIYIYRHVYVCAYFIYTHTYTVNISINKYKYISVYVNVCRHTLYIMYISIYIKQTVYIYEHTVYSIYVYMWVMVRWAGTFHQLSKPAKPDSNC